MDLEALIEQLDLMAHFQVEALVPAVEGISDAIGQQNALLQQQNALMTRIVALLEVKRGGPLDSGE